MSVPDPSKHFPPLAPGPTPRIYAGQSSVVASRSKKNSTACLPCKAAKRKCSGDGTSPCNPCRTAGTACECRFDPTRDLRRKIAVKKTIQELTGYKSLLNTLLTTIRLSPQEEVSRIVELVKNNGSMQEIAQAVGSHATFPDSSQTARLHQAHGEDLNHADSLSNERSASISHSTTEPIGSSTSPEAEPNIESPRAALHPYARVTLESLCDIPLFRVPARPWTGVTDDSDLVSHLVSLYFTWDHPCAQFVDQGIFLDHMRRGDLSSEYCSPLLVNTLLSIASVYSDSPDVFSNPENEFSRGQSFFEEAERLLKPQEGLATLTNIQALLMMLSQQGKSSRAWWILRGAVQMAQDMGLFTFPEVAHSSTEAMSPEMERVRAITAWGVFSLNLQLSMKLHKVANLARPVSRLNMGGDDDFDWTPYPRSNQINYTTKSALLPQIRQGLGELTDILVDIQEILHDKALRGSFHKSMTKAKVPYERLQQWLSRWPSPSQIGPEPIPQLLILRIKCLQAVMDLLETLISRDQECTMTPQLRRTWREQAEKMAQCLLLYRQSYGLKQVPSQVVDAVQSVLPVLVHQLDDSDDVRNAFTELCRFGIALSQKFQPTADTIHAIQLLAQRGVVKLPTEAIAILDGSEL
ncbi:hypothetical protein PMG11_07860 [Penicillium brasilianum]|uniref:Zn(2)-C6 fungal-type domain-containing protein n=1 Tax=Penicillium brasilianum TaxID=104259 RepID=A0A0F7TR99_PENBI|nr:hypothetical protein PMG11_07860 [Penicillium brasilianum]